MQILIESSLTVRSVMSVTSMRVGDMDGLGDMDGRWSYCLILRRMYNYRIASPKRHRNVKRLVSTIASSFIWIIFLFFYLYFFFSVIIYCDFRLGCRKRYIYKPADHTTSNLTYFRTHAFMSACV